MTNILKYFFYQNIDAELKKPIEQIAAESKTRNDDENNRYFENLFNRQHELNAQTTTGAGR